MARLLSPEDYGLFAIAASYVAVVEGLADFNVTNVLIRDRDEDRSLYDTAWTLSVARGALASIGLLVVAGFLTDARIALAVRVLAVSPLLMGFANPRFVMFERDLDYSRLATLMLAARAASIGVTLTIALATRSYLALVAGLVAGSLVHVVLTYVMRPYRPAMSMARVRDIFAFSGWMSLTAMVTTIALRTDRIIVGWFAGVAEAGSYYMTNRVGVVPTGELAGPLRQVLFPSFSSIAGDKARLSRTVTESIGVVASMSLPAGVGFAFAVNDFVPLVLGERWLLTVPLLQVLVPFLALRSTLSMTLPCMMALGETRLLFRVSLAYALVHLPLFIGATALYGLTGAIGSVVAGSLIYSYFNVIMLRRTLGLSWVEVISQLRRPALALAVMSVVILAAAGTPWLDVTSTDGSWSSLAAKVVLGVAVFGAAHYAIWRQEGRPAGIERRVLQMLSR